MKTAVEQDVVTSAADQPHGVHRVDLLVARRADDHLSNGITRRVRDTNRLNRVGRRLRLGGASRVQPQRRGLDQKMWPTPRRTNSPLPHSSSRKENSRGADKNPAGAI